MNEWHNPVLSLDDEPEEDDGNSFLQNSVVRINLPGYRQEEIGTE